MSDRQKQISKVTLWGAAVNLLLTAGKILAGVFGRSAAMIADGVHSLSDLLSDAVVLILTHVASKDKDRKHRFGHGKFETMATVIISIILVVVAAKLMSNGIKSILACINGEVLPRPGFIALAAAVISIVSKEILYQWTAAVGKKTGSTAVMANAWHHRSDAMSSIGALLGIGGAIILGERWTILDPVTSCGISIAIMVVAVKMAMPSLEELLETSLPEEIEKEIIDIAISVPGVNDIHELKTRRNGMSFIIDAHVVVDSGMTVVEGHDIATNVEEALRSRFGNETQTSIHIEPDTAAR